MILRNFFHNLSYNEEWFFQYLTFLYLPLLWVWLRDAGVDFKTNPYLILSIAAFVFVDVEGNILFIPELRALIHRNDLVVGHAHIAMGIGVAFMALSIAHHLLPAIFRRSYATAWTVLISLMALVLSIAGLVEAGLIGGAIEPFLMIRAGLGLMVLFLVVKIGYDRLIIPISTSLQIYHLIGFLGDAFGGLALLIAGGWLFGLLGFAFSGTYEYVVFAFVIGTGMIHWFGLHGDEERMASLSATIRLLVSSTFACFVYGGNFRHSCIA